MHKEGGLIEGSMEKSQWKPFGGISQGELSFARFNKGESHGRILQRFVSLEILSLDEW